MGTAVNFSMGISNADKIKKIYLILLACQLVELNFKENILISLTNKPLNTKVSAISKPEEWIIAG